MSTCPALQAWAEHNNKSLTPWDTTVVAQFLKDEMLGWNGKRVRSCQHKALCPVPWQIDVTWFPADAKLIGTSCVLVMTACVLCLCSVQGSKWLESCHSALASIHKVRVLQMANSERRKQPAALLDCIVYRNVYDLVKRSCRTKDGR